MFGIFDKLFIYQVISFQSNIIILASENKSVISSPYLILNYIETADELRTYDLISVTLTVFQIMVIG